LYLILTIKGLIGYTKDVDLLMLHYAEVNRNYLRGLFNNICVKPNSQQIVPIPKSLPNSDLSYIPKIESIVQGEPFPAERLPGEPLEGEILIEPLKEIFTDDFYRMLDDFLGNDPVKLLCFRSFLFRIINAPTKGHLFQQCFWIYGSPSSGKSVLQRVLAAIAGPGWSELVANVGDFNLANLAQATFVTLSDVDNMSADRTKHLRVLIGRDKATAHINYEQAPVTFVSYANFFIVSNRDPNEFKFYNLEEMRDKITPVYWGHSVRNINPFMTEMVLDFKAALMIWGASMPNLVNVKPLRSKEAYDPNELRHDMLYSFNNKFCQEMNKDTIRDIKDIYIKNKELKTVNHDLVEKIASEVTLINQKISQQQVQTMKDTTEIQISSDNEGEMTVTTEQFEPPKTPHL
jgi:hypothetical protein